MAMAGSVFSLMLLWVVVSLTSTSKTQAKVGGKDKQAALSDGDVSSEDGASDVATGTGIAATLDRAEQALVCFVHQEAEELSA